MLEDIFSKNILMMKRMKRVFPINTAVNNNLLLQLHANTRKLIVLRSKMIKYHILKISAMQATLVGT